MGETYFMNYTGANFFRIGPVRFSPGINAITSDQWDAIKAHPALKERMAKKALVWHKGPAGKDAFPDTTTKAKGGEILPEPETASPEVLSELSPKEAHAVVVGTLDVNVLKAWDEVEKRRAVKTSIKEQIKLIESQKVVRAKSENADMDIASELDDE